VPGIWSRNFYDPKDLEKQEQNYYCVERNESGIKRFRETEGSEFDEALLKWF
jgi:hypothetical protein